MVSLKMVNTPVTLAGVADALNLLFIYKWFRRCVGRLQRRLDPKPRDNPANEIM